MANPFLIAILLAAPVATTPSPGDDALTRALSEGGVHLDLENELCLVNARVGVTNELLEYLVVGPRGAAHESMFVVEAMPSVLNTALLALGAEPGSNAKWSPIEPPPSQAERRKGAPVYDVTPPSGDGFFLYIAWREEGEIFLFRIEDVLTNLGTGTRMKRHRWVYLGSRFIEDENGEEVFAADLEQNLVNVSFFHEGHTLVTAALPECVEQTIWMANPWILPPREASVQLVFTRRPIRVLPDRWEAQLDEAVREDE